jgi:hypothetical protein
VGKIALANDDDVIKTFPSDRADPRRPRRDCSVAAHGLDAPHEGNAIRTVAVADQVAWRLMQMPLPRVAGLLRAPESDSSVIEFNPPLG